MFRFALFCLLLMINVSPAYADNIGVTGGTIFGSVFGISVSLQGPDLNLGGGNNGGALSVPSEGVAGSLLGVWVNGSTLGEGTLLGTSYPGPCSFGFNNCPSMNVGGFASFTTPTDQLMNVTVSVPMPIITYSISGPFGHPGSFVGSTTGIASVSLTGFSCPGGWCYREAFFQITLASNVPEPSALMLVSSGAVILMIGAYRRRLRTDNIYAS